MANADSEDPVEGRTRHVLARVLARAGMSGAGGFAAAALLIRVASAGLAYLTNIVLARLLGQGAFGDYAFVWTCTIVLGDLAHFGFAYAAQRYIPQYLHDRLPDLLRGFIAGSQAFVAAMASLIAIIGLAAVWLFAPLDRPEIGLLVFALAATPFWASTNLLDGIARSFDWPLTALIPPYILRPLLIIALCAALPLAGFPLDARTALAASLVATIAAAVVQFVLVRRRLRAATGAGPARTAFGEWLPVTAAIFAVMGFSTLATYADIIALRLLRSPAEVGAYFAAAKTLLLIGFVQFAVTASVAHRLAERHRAGDPAGLQALLSNATRWIFWPSAAGVALLLALGRQILGLFGASFPEAFPVMAILAVGLIARASVGPAERLLNMAGEQRACVGVYAVTLVLIVALCLVLIPRYGVLGAATAVAAGMCIEAALLAAVVRTRLRLVAFVLPGRTRPG